MSSDIKVERFEPVRLEPVLEQRPAFSIGNGANQTRATWERVIRVLNSRGYEVIIVDFNSGDSNSNFEEYAGQMAAAEKIRQAKNIVRVGWSHGANVIPRGNLDYVSGLIFVDPGLEQATLLGFTDDENLDLPDKNLPHYFNAIKKVQPADAVDRGVSVIQNGVRRSLEWSTRGLYTVDANIAPEVFYSDCDPHIAKKLGRIAANRWQRRLPEEQPTFQGYDHDLRLGGVISTADQLLTEEYKRKILEVIGVPEEEIVEINSGHAPMVSRTLQFADALINFANRS